MFTDSTYRGAKVVAAVPENTGLASIVYFDDGSVMRHTHGGTGKWEKMKPHHEENTPKNEGLE